MAFRITSSSRMQLIKKWVCGIMFWLSETLPHPVCSLSRNKFAVSCFERWRWGQLTWPSKIKFSWADGFLSWCKLSKRLFHLEVEPYLYIYYITSDRRLFNFDRRCICSLLLWHFVRKSERKPSNLPQTWYTCSKNHNSPLINDV